MKGEMNLLVALMPHSGKEAALALAEQLIARLEKDGVRIWLEPEAAALLGREDLAGSDEELALARVALVLGGDGAFLKAARLAAPHGVPILGVNLGHLGFLTAVEPSGLDEALARVFRGDYSIEERLMLKAEVWREGQLVASSFGLNDAAVTRGTFARVIEFETWIDGSLIGTFLADGMIVATPTGSTAYSLSAGGPIVHPGVRALIVTPICPHTIGARTIVTMPDQQVTIRILSRDDAMLTVDGQVGESLKAMDRVVVGRASKPARLVSLGDRSFYGLIHNRLRQRKN